MSVKKPPSKTVGKMITVKTSKNSKTKPTGVKVTVKHGSVARKIQPAPKTGKISPENIKRAVESVPPPRRKK